MKILKVIGGGAALLAMALTASANSVPTKTRSAYGDDGSPQLVSSSTLSDGVTVNEIFFCSDATQSAATGNCDGSLAFQITSALPAGTTAFTLDMPLPTGTSLANEFGLQVGFLTNDNPITSPTAPILPFSPFTLAQAGLFDASVGSDALGNPTFTLLSPLTIPGGGTGLTLYVDLADLNNTSGSGFCYQAGTNGTSCTGGSDIPKVLPAPSVSTTGGTAPMPEPSSLMMLGSGLVGLIGFARRKRA
jgi:hypothetical protein